MSKPKLVFTHDLLRAPELDAPLEKFGAWLDRIRGQAVMIEAMQIKSSDLKLDPWEHQGYIDEDPPEDSDGQE